MNNKHFWNKIKTGLLIVSLNFLFAQNAHAHLPTIGDLFFYPFVGTGVGSIIGALLAKKAYVGAVVGAVIGHFTTTIAMGLILNMDHFTSFVLLLGMIPALISGIVVGLIVNSFRTQRHKNP